METGKGKITYQQHILILLAGFCIIGGILHRAGTLHSGYHFLDDHEVLRIHYEITENGKSVFFMLKKFLMTDLRSRFRPFYWVERVFFAYLFGENMYLWNLYTLLKGGLSFYFLYFTARYLHFGSIISFYFAGVIMLGTQFTPWYRSANQENTGLLLGALTLYLIARQAYEKKYRSRWRNGAICAGAVLCGWIKESFTIFLPVFVILKFWLEYRESGEPFKKCVRSNLFSYLVILFSAVLDAGLLFFMVGLDHVTYAGFQEGTPISEYLQGIKSSLLVYTKWYTGFGLLLLFAVVMGCQRPYRETLREQAGYLLIGSYTIVIELAAHAKSMMFERYLIPYIIGWAFLFVLSFYQVLAREKEKQAVYLITLTVLLLVQAPQMMRQARDYAYDGQMTGVVLQTLAEHTGEKEQIICAFKDDELNVSAESWLQTHARTQVYSYDWGKKKFRSRIRVAGEKPASQSWEAAKAVVCYEGDTEAVLKKMKLKDEKQYSVERYYRYAVIVKAY